MKCCVLSTLKWGNQHNNFNSILESKASNWKSELDAMDNPDYYGKI